MSLAVVFTLVSLSAVSIASAIELIQLLAERPKSVREWSIGLLDAWTKAQIIYLKNLHWVILSMIFVAIAWSVLGPAERLPYPFDVGS